MTDHAVRAVGGTIPRPPVARRQPARMSGVPHSVAVPAAWGGALVLIGLGAGAIVGTQTGAAGRIGGVGIATLGLAVFLWAALSLSAGRMLAPRLAVAGCLAGVLGAGALLAVDPQRTSVVAVAIATGLLALTAVCTVAARRSDCAAAPLRVPALIAMAALVAVVATPAFGSVQDAVLRQSDGTSVVVPAHEGH